MESEIIEKHRKKTILWVNLVSLSCVVPFVLNHLHHQRWLMAMVSCTVLLFLSTNSVSVYRKDQPKYDPIWLAPAVGVFLILSILKQSMIGILWSYPAVMLFYFVLEPRRARWVNAGLLLICFPLAFSTQPEFMAWRVVATLMAVSLSCAVFVHLIALQQKELYLAAVVDPLTQVHNRLQMPQILERSCSRFERYGHPSTLLSLDIDNFKLINDCFGHAEGDRVLKVLAFCLKSKLRESDVIFRSGGEEFLILLDGTSEIRAMAVAEKLRELVRESVVLPSMSSVTVSIGVAQLCELEGVDRWLKRADDRLYMAKRAGRDQVVGSTVEGNLAII